MFLTQLYLINLIDLNNKIKKNISIKKLKKTWFEFIQISMLNIQSSCNIKITHRK